MSFFVSLQSVGFQKDMMMNCMNIQREKKHLGGRTTFKRSSAGEVGMRQRKKIMPKASKKAGLDRLGKQKGTNYGQRVKSPLQILTGIMGDLKHSFKDLQMKLRTRI